MWRLMRQFNFVIWYKLATRNIITNILVDFEDENHSHINFRTLQLIHLVILIFPHWMASGIHTVVLVNTLSCKKETVTDSCYRLVQWLTIWEPRSKTVSSSQRLKRDAAEWNACCKYNCGSHKSNFQHLTLWYSCFFWFIFNPPQIIQWNTTTITNITKRLQKD